MTLFMGFLLCLRLLRLSGTSSSFLGHCHPQDQLQIRAFLKEAILGAARDRTVVVGNESAGAVICSGPWSCLCCTWSCFQETPLLSQGHQDTLLLPGGRATKKQEVTINLGGREKLCGMDRSYPVHSHPGEKRVRLNETWLSSWPEPAAFQEAPIAVCPQDLCSEPSHSTQPSLFSAFLHHISNSCGLQPACPQPFLLHFPPTSHSQPGLFDYLLVAFWPMFFPPAAYIVTSSVLSQWPTHLPNSCMSGTLCCSLCTGHYTTWTCSWWQWQQQTQWRGWQHLHHQLSLPRNVSLQCSRQTPLQDCLGFSSAANPFCQDAVWWH